MATGRLALASTPRMVSTFSRRRSRGRWLMLRRNTSAPASCSRAIISGLSEAGPRVAMILVRRERFMSPAPSLNEKLARGWRVRCNNARRKRPCHGRLSIRPLLQRCSRPARIGELDGPALLLAGVHLEEARAVETAGQAILDTANGELPVAGAHEGAAGPLAAAGAIVEGVEVVEAGGE